MRNFFSYLRLPASSNNNQVLEALSNVPHDEYDIHHVLSDDVSTTHYKRVHLQCTAMAVLLASAKEDDDILDKMQWQQRLSEFNVLESRAV
ncbi:MAG: hypothetical protein V3U65_18840 [Granulosicoccaceae bacterium]